MREAKEGKTFLKKKIITRVGFIVDPTGTFSGEIDHFSLRKNCCHFFSFFFLSRVEFFCFLNRETRRTPSETLYTLALLLLYTLPPCLKSLHLPPSKVSQRVSEANLEFLYRYTIDRLKDTIKYS